jgi:hypothetical protein
MTSTTATSHADRGLGLLATLVVAGATTFSLYLTYMPAAASASVGTLMFAAAISALIHAQWGAVVLGVAALWSAIHEIPLRRPIALFALGVAASLVVEGAAFSSYEYYSKKLSLNERASFTAQPVTGTR